MAFILPPSHISDISDARFNLLPSRLDPLPALLETSSSLQDVIPQGAALTTTANSSDEERQGVLSSSVISLGGQVAGGNLPDNLAPLPGVGGVNLPDALAPLSPSPDEQLVAGTQVCLLDVFTVD